MPFTVDLQEGESCIANLSFVADKKKPPFFIAIGDRALYLLRSKLVAVRDATYTQRVPLENVREVRVYKVHPLISWIVAATMVTVGVSITWLMLLPILRGERGQVSGYPPAIAIVGAVIPFAIRRRYALRITLTDGTYKWKPPIVIDTASKNAINAFLGQIIEASRTARLNVVDEREVAREPQKDLPTSKYPIAKPYEATPVRGSNIRNCYHCGRPLLISKWDDWNGFLFTCPHCGNIHGKSWNPFAVVFSSIFLNAFTFFATLRWRKALPLFIVFAAYGAAASWALDEGRMSQSVELLVMSGFFVGPAVINAYLLLRHQFDLSRVAAFSAKA